MRSIVIRIAAVPLALLSTACFDDVKGRQTHNSLSQIANAAECYRVAKGGYPATTSIDAFIDAVRPFAREPLERHDRWGQPFRVTSSPALYRISSDGSDGLQEQALWRVGGTDRRGADLVVTNGWFTRWPSGGPSYIMHECGSKPSTDPAPNDIGPYPYRYTYIIEDISLENWRQAVAGEKDLRLADNGDVEIRVDAERDKWIRLFRFDNGRIAFTANVNKHGIPEPPVYAIVGRLLRKLNAVVVGEDGEVRTWY